METIILSGGDLGGTEVQIVPGLLWYRQDDYVYRVINGLAVFEGMYPSLPPEIQLQIV